MRVVTTHVFPSPICFICYILGKFYLLPKIHKRTSNVPGSSVISNNGTATDNIFAFLDFHLKKIQFQQYQILEDTKGFLQRLNQIEEIHENTLLVSFDVADLYTHIPHDRDVEIMRRFLDKHEEQSVPSESICILAKMVLKYNYFKMGKDVYHQILGTAIGTNLLHIMLTYLWLVSKRYLKNRTFKPTFGCGIQMIFSAYELKDLKI